MFGIVFTKLMVYLGE